jgi:hypothetical protein
LGEKLGQRGAQLHFADHGLAAAGFAQSIFRQSGCHFGAENAVIQKS